jgi:hypothetical protein
MKIKAKLASIKHPIVIMNLNRLCSNKEPSMMFAFTRRTKKTNFGRTEFQVPSIAPAAPRALR